MSQAKLSIRQKFRNKLSLRNDSRDHANPALTNSTADKLSNDAESERHGVPHDDSLQEPAAQTLPSSIWQEAFSKLEEDEAAYLLKASPDFQKRDRGIEINGKVSDLPIKVARRVQEAKEKREQNHPSLRKGFEITVRILEFGKDTIADIASSNPYAAAAWTATSFLLPLLLVPSAENKDATVLLESIVHFIEIYRWYEMEHGRETSFKEKAKELYVHIFRCEVALYIHFFERRAPSRFGHNIKNKGMWSEKLEELRKLDHQCSRLVEVMRENAMLTWRNHEDEYIRQLLGKLDEVLKNINDKDISKQLVRLDMNYRGAKDQNPDRVQGTCQWFLKHPDFLNWKQRKLPSLLWVSADPGCGKSVLSKSLLGCDAAVLSNGHWKDYLVCYFFFKDGYENQQEAAKAVGVLIHQLVMQAPELSVHVKSLAKRSNDALDFELLWKTLLDILSSPLVKELEIICVIDALDECRQASRTSFIRRIVELFSQGSLSFRENHCFKMIVTSRPYLDIEIDFDDLLTDIPEIRLRGEDESEKIEEEIKLVIKSQVKEIGPKIGLSQEKSRQKLEKALSEVENKTYLWLYLVLDFLQYKDNGQRQRRRFSSEYEMLATLRMLPPSIEDAYRKMLERSTNENGAKKLLHIVLCAQRPLTVKEAFVALKIDYTKRSFDDINDGFLQDSPTELKNLCGLILRIADEKVYLIHQTAREFLIETESEISERKHEPNTESSSNWRHSFDPQYSNAQMVNACIALFQLSEFATTSTEVGLYSHLWYEIDRQPLEEKYLDCFPLLNYAFDHIFHHLQASGSLTDLSVWMFIEKKLLNPTEKLYYIGQASQKEEWFFSTPGIVYASWGLLKGLEYEYSHGADLLEFQSIYTPLSKATENGHYECVEFILREVYRDQRCIWPYLSRRSQSPLHVSSSKGFSEISRLILQHSTLWTHVQNESGQSTLYGASSSAEEDFLTFKTILGHMIQCTCPEEARVLMSQHPQDSEVSISSFLEAIYCGDGYYSALIAACKQGHIQIVKKLLLHLYSSSVATKRHRVEPTFNYGDQNRMFEGNWYNGEIEKCLYTSLDQAITYGQRDIVTLLIDNGLDINGAPEMDPPLYSSIVRGNSEMARMLLEKGADIHQIDDNIFQLIDLGNSEIVKFLFDHGFDIDIEEQEWVDDPDSIDINSFSTFAQLFLGRVHDKDTSNSYLNDSALYIACLGGQTGAISRLLDEGADINVTSPYLGTTLHAAVVSKKYSTVKLLLENEVDVNISGGQYDTALQTACFFGSEDIVKLLLESGADVDITGGFFHTALQAACYVRSDDIVRLLLKSKADVNIAGGEYGSALAAACYSKSEEIVKLLLDSGADIDMKIVCEKYNSALEVACGQGAERIVEEFLENRANIDLINGNHRSALHWASNGGSTETSMLLLRHGAYIDTTPEGIHRLLITACHNGSEGIVKFLLEKGINVNTNIGGQSALLAALTKCHFRIAKLLRSYGAEVTSECENLPKEITPGGQWLPDLTSTSDLQVPLTLRDSEVYQEYICKKIYLQISAIIDSET